MFPGVRLVDLSCSVILDIVTIYFHLFITVGIMSPSRMIVNCHFNLFSLSLVLLTQSSSMNGRGEIAPQNRIAKVVLSGWTRFGISRPSAAHYA